MKPTPQEILNEIEALKKCFTFVPKYNLFDDNNHAGIQLQIDVLSGEIDAMSEEFHDYDSDEQSAIMEADDWMEGLSDESPSSGWQSFNPDSKKSKSKKKKK